MNWKYIVFDMGMAGETPILFPSHVSHSDVADAFKFSKVISAGFVSYSDVERAFRTWGKSDSLRIESREIDARCINRIFGKHL